MAAATPLSFSLARGVEEVLRRVCRRWRGTARWLSSPWAPAAALASMGTVGALVTVVKTRHLIAVLPLWPLWAGLIMLGLMGEFYTRKHASLSWNARR